MSGVIYLGCKGPHSFFLRELYNSESRCLAPPLNALPPTFFNIKIRYLPKLKGLKFINIRMPPQY